MSRLTLNIEQKEALQRISASVERNPREFKKALSRSWYPFIAHLSDLFPETTIRLILKHYQLKETPS